MYTVLIFSGPGKGNITVIYFRGGGAGEGLTKIFEDGLYLSENYPHLNMFVVKNFPVPTIVETRGSRR